MLDNFTFNSFELYTSNVFTQLQDCDSSLDSIVPSCFSPLHASSSHPSSQIRKAFRQRLSESDSSSRLTEGTSTTSENVVVPEQTDLRSMQSWNIKPDLICGTETWLRGVKPGHDPEKNSIKTSEVLPPNYTVLVVVY